MTTSRREFFTRVATGSAALLVTSSVSRAQQQPRGMVHDSSLVKDSTGNLFAMDQDAAIPVRLPPKPNAKPSMTDLERDELEHHIHCQCGCTLSVFICRTTDFSCRVSPAMHHDIIQLVHDGYGAQEIIDAFVNVYGERALMAPKTSGFNLLAWILPGTALVVGGGALALLLKRWGERSRERASRDAMVKPFVASRGDSDATPEELARLEAAVRGDDNG
jgi:cytochrome c-type biogenesis protein CcmH